AQILVEPVAVGETGQRIVLREVPHPLRFMLARRNVTQRCAILESVDAAPGGEAGFEREGLAILAAPGELDDPAVRPWPGGGKRTGNRERSAPLGAAGGADAAERPAQHLVRRVAENGAGGRVPDGDQAGLVDADEAVAERHRDLPEAPFLGATQE